MYRPLRYITARLFNFMQLTERARTLLGFKLLMAAAAYQ